MNRRPRIHIRCTVCGLTLEWNAWTRLNGHIARLEAERNALGAWACDGCGARFPKPEPPALLKGVTHCTKCIEVRVLVAHIARLEADRARLLAALRAYGDHSPDCARTACDCGWAAFEEEDGDGE